MSCYELNRLGFEIPGTSAPKKPKKKPKAKKEGRPNKSEQLRDNDLRPLTKVETNFVKDVAQAWLAANQNASQEEFLEIVRALGIGIRS
jgi:hypothetical protein